MSDKIESANDYGSVTYSVVFDQKVLDVLSQENVAKNFSAYIKKYNELVNSVGYYSKGGFSPLKADAVVKTLEKEKYFEAKNKVVLNGQANPIIDAKGLHDQIEGDRARILQDPQLKTISDAVISSVAAVRTFQEMIEGNEAFLSELEDIEGFRVKLWLSYFHKEADLVRVCSEEYVKGQARMRAIEECAKIELTKWYEVKQVFKQRFDVPFEIEIQDQVNSILGTKSPNVVFVFSDTSSGSKKTYTKETVQSLKVLSQGERRAMYLLQVIFDVESRRANAMPTLFIVDDIADSFDYRNKYAIIEYLKDMNDEPFFRLLVLSHNYDFFRTVQSRILGQSKWDNSFIALKDDNCVLLAPFGNKASTNPFDYWKTRLKSNPTMLLASISFVRNLVEYKEGQSHSDYQLLTSLLHIKPDTHTITLSQLEQVFARYLNNVDFGISGRENLRVSDLILTTAESIVSGIIKETAEIDIKVTLSIAIRLLAETYMWSNISDTNAIAGSQTGVLFDRFKKEYASDPSKQEVVRTLGAVNLMTPENIHLNSFMYEPILDMSNHHLVNLYQKVAKLNQV